MRISLNCLLFSAAIAFLVSFPLFYAQAQACPAASRGGSDYCPGPGSEDNLRGNQADFICDPADPAYGTVGVGGNRIKIIGGLVPCGRNCDDPLTAKIDESLDCQFCHFFYFLQKIINWAIFTIAPLVAALLVTFGGFLLAASRGDPGQAANGKKVIIWSLGGYAVILAAWVVVNGVFTGIGLQEWTGLGVKLWDWWQLRCPLQ